MKKLISLLAATGLLLTACGSQLSVASSEDQKAYPEAKGIMQTWQSMVDAAEEGDCEAFMSLARASVVFEGNNCDAAFAYMEDAPEVDWSKTQWDSNQSKGKIYETNKGDITSFIYNSSNDEWKFDSAFWAN